MEANIGVVEGLVDEGGGGVLLGEGGGGGDVVMAEGIDIVVDDRGASDPLSDANDDDAPSDSVRGRRQVPKEEMAERLEADIAAYKADLYKSVRQCALAFRVNHCTLNNMLKDPDRKFVGKGKVSKVFSTEEETRIASHIQERMLIGCGMDIMQVRMTQ